MESTLFLDGVSLLGPGFANWAEARSILCDETSHAPCPMVTIPAPSLLPTTERRRAGVSIKLSMAIGLAAAADARIDPSMLANVFSSSSGDCENCHSMLEALASHERMVSPTRFHNSVHNAAAGYWNIATRCTAASISLSACDASFSAGLLEAACQVFTSRSPCLLIAFDTIYPEPLHTLRPIPHPFGVGMVLSPQRSMASQAALRLSLTRDPVDTLLSPPLEQLRREIPSARSLPLLQYVARRMTRRVVIDYLDDTSLAIEVSP